MALGARRCVENGAQAIRGIVYHFKFRLVRQERIAGRFVYSVADARRRHVSRQGRSRETGWSLGGSVLRN